MKIIGAILFYGGLMFISWLLFSTLFLLTWNKKTGESQDSDKHVGKSALMSFVSISIPWGAYFMWIY